MAREPDMATIGVNGPVGSVVPDLDDMRGYPAFRMQVRKHCLSLAPLARTGRSVTRGFAREAD